MMETDVSPDGLAVAELLTVSKRGEPHVLLHYLYFPNQRDAREVAVELRRLGFTTEERIGGDSENCLVLARHEIVPTEESVLADRELMESLVEPVGGDYDGWEAAVKG
jgi:hypothetical protein